LIKIHNDLCFFVKPDCRKFYHVPKAKDGLYAARTAHWNADILGVAEKEYCIADKTNYLPLLPGGRKVVFCVRPSRRFGKSLPVSTLDAFYSGRKELYPRFGGSGINEVP
jgi:hypothetical protein